MLVGFYAENDFVSTAYDSLAPAVGGSSSFQNKRKYEFRQPRLFSQLPRAHNALGPDPLFPSPLADSSTCLLSQ
jgi:hypothetical protein